MASKIVITKSEVDNIVSNLQDTYKDIATDAKTLNTETEAINEAWKGTDAVAYTAKMKDDYVFLLEKLNESLQSYTDFLSGVYGEYDKHNSKFEGMTIEV